jgi:DNA-directed RNA polymerase subunit beta'
MAHLDPKEAFEHLQERVLAGLSGHFPMEGKVQSLHLDKLEVKDDLHPDDIRGQHKAKVEGKSWAVPVYAHLSLKDNATGKTIDQRRVRIAELPKTTRRYSHIVDGQEYQLDNQWQLKPGVYARRQENGQLEAKFNVQGRRSFDLNFDPASKEFHMEYNKSHIPIYPVMKTMGVDDATLKTAWGPEVLEANKKARFVGTALERFYKSDRKSVAPSPEAAAEHVFATLTASKLRPEATAVTLGKGVDHVSGEALRLATEKLLKVQSGHPEDDRDSLVFKDLRTVGDYAHDKLVNGEHKRSIQYKIARKINTAKDVRDIVKFDWFQKPILDTFHKNAAARVPGQINPLEMVSAAMQTTVMGPGGIQSERSVTDEAKFVNPSHLGFLDPIQTPEGNKTGVTLRLPIGIRKVGSEAKIPLFNLGTNKMELVSSTDFIRSNVVLPDQVKWEDGRPVPLHSTVKMAATDNVIRQGKFADAHYVLRHPSQLFNMTSNLIPFLGNTSGNRATMASRYMEQAISLVHREEPLVQVATGVETKGIDTFEGLLGKQASHAAPVAGKIIAIQKDAVILQAPDGKKHEIQLYRHYPLNDAKSVMTSTPVVKVGDQVRAGQLVADTNFSKHGVLALGTNLRVGYLPLKGYNFEDGVVISDSAAKKLTSEHLTKHLLKVDDKTRLSSKHFQLLHPGVFTREQMSRLDEDGVAKVGTMVSPGDPLVAATTPFEVKDRTGLSAIRRSMTGAHTDRSLRWDSEVSGEVVGVHRQADQIAVHVRTAEPMQVGDKLSGRYGNKGIVTMILPDHEMPHTKDGKHIEVALNPSGVPGRMNVGQVLETAVAKIAEKTGKPYLVKNFEPGVDFVDRVQHELKMHGIEDKEELFDPATKRSIGKVLVGPQHMLKLVHQVDKKLSVRSGMTLPGTSVQGHYDLNLQPSSGSGTGGQSMGALGLYALLAHGAKANIREMHTYKSEGPDPQTNALKKWPSQHNDVWAAIQTGAPLPPPKPTFAFQKFTDYLKGAGINVEKKGHNLVLTPFTDKQIVALAPKALPKAGELLFAKVDKQGNPKPKPGGLFDEQLTGGHGGRLWSRIDLAEPVPNPVFESAIRHLTGLKQTEFDAIVAGQKGVSPSGHVTETANGVTGGRGIKLLLDRIDVKKALGDSKRDLKAATTAVKVDHALKRVKYLQALDQADLKPAEAYVLHHLPVLPPVMRPITVMQDGNLKYSDINGLYSDFAQINDKLRDPLLTRHLSDAAKSELRHDYYDGVKALMGVGIPYADAKQKGLLHYISGSSPKHGFFQDALIHRKQDLTMRSTIVPEPALGLDEVGIPRHAALDLFRPFVVQKLVHMGAAKTALDAPKIIEEKGPAVWKALDQAMDERPVLLKRDPALHKYSVQAFKARPVAGSAIQIHPLVTGGYNADFDGDTMGVFVPLHHDAVAEARKMFPSNNLFSEATGKVMYQPTLESALGLYKLSLTGKETGKTFRHAGEVIEAVRDGKHHMNDIVHLGKMKTTAGRILLAAAVPEPLQHKLLSDLDMRLDRKQLDTLLTDVAKGHHTDFGSIVNHLKDLGNGAVSGAVSIPKPLAAGHPFTFSKNHATLDPSKTISVPIDAHSLGLSDFVADKETRNKVLAPATKEVEEIYANTKIPTADKDRRAVDVWERASKKMREVHEVKAEKNPSNLFLMYKAGIKPGWDQYKQMTLAPMLLRDSADRVIPTPVTKSYGEGLDVGGYWTQMHGARRGAVMKVQEVQEPGYLSKLLMNNMMHISVNSPDCGTDKGIALPVSENDVHDRHLAHDFVHGRLHVPAGTLLTPDIIGKIRASKKDAQVVVRSPLKCEEEKGICQKCVGLSATGQYHPLGTNVGVQAAQAIGERAIQLTLKAFHTGGVQEQGGGKLLNSFSRLEQLMTLPQKIPDAATLAMKGGRIEKLEHTPTGVDIVIAGHRHHVGKDSRGMALHEPLPGASSNPGYTLWAPPKVGSHFEAGQHLSDPNRTFVNPHDLYHATGSLEQVQHHLTGEVYDLYKDEGIRRRAVETVIRGISNLTKVDDPGDHPDLLRGEFRSLSSIRRMNGELAREKKKLIDHTPVLKGIQMMPLSLQEDWMAKLQHQRLRDTLTEAVSTGAASNLHGPHPIPGIAYGAEFGLTSAVAKVPGHQHLKNVPVHGY